MGTQADEHHETPRKPSPEVTGKVIPFEPRRPGSRPRQLHHSSLPSRPPGTRSDEHDPDNEQRDDFRHRMKTNAATVVVVGLLIWCGLWLADTLAQMRKTQDCVLSGLRNCAPITLPEHER